MRIWIFLTFPLSELVTKTDSRLPKNDRVTEFKPVRPNDICGSCLCLTRAPLGECLALNEDPSDLVLVRTDLDRCWFTIGYFIPMWQ